MGLRNAIPKAVNWSMLYGVRQGKDETPSEFLDRLRAAMRQYTPLDPATEEGKQHLLGLMMGQSNPDIRKKLQKLEHPANKNLETLLNEAWKVYNNREVEEKKKEDRRIARVVAVAVAAQKTGYSEPGTRGRDPLVKIELGEGKKELDFLIDTGATFSVLNQEFVPKSDEFVQVVGATGQPEKAYFLKPIKYKIGKQMGIHQFLYLPNSPKPLLGRDLLENLGAVIKFNKDQLEFQVNEEQLITALSLTISCVEPKPESHNFEQILSQTYPLVWATDIPGKSKQAAPIVVELKAGTKPVRKKQYPLRIEDRKGIEPTIRRFMELGLLVECESDFNTPILPVKKPNGTYRLVQDLRAVNEITKALHPVVANPYTLLTRLKENLAWFTVLDLKDAFFCLPLALESQKIFAFEWESVDSGRKTQLTWTVLPQGWCNSPTIFGNQLAKELEQWERPLGDGTLLQYVDDLLIATVTEEECIEWTISLLNFLGLNGYRVSRQKAQLVQTQVVYLGYEVSRGQRSLGAARKEAICQMPKPETVRDLRAFLGMTGWCRLWIYQYGILAKPLYDLLKEAKSILVWTPEAEEAFKKLKMELMRAPALGLPDVSKPFWLFSHERQGMALGVLAQQLGPHKRAVAYFSKRLDEVSKGWPGCLRAVAAVIINIEEARKLTLGQKVTVLVSHTVSAVLEQKGNHWLSPSRFLKYQAVLAESDDVTIQVTNIVNPASFLEGRAPAEPIEHDCLETIEAVYSSRPDLKEEPFEDADNWFSDGSSFVKQGVRMAGYAVTTTERVIESNPLPTGTSAQKAELIALTRALELAENMQINIWTDSKYAFSVVHAHGAIWKERGLLTTQGKTVKHAEEVLRLLEAVQLPAQVAIMHCKGHLKGNTIPEIGNRKADTEAKLAATKSREVGITALIPGDHSPQETTPPAECKVVHNLTFVGPQVIRKSNELKLLLDPTYSLKKVQMNIRVDVTHLQKDCRPFVQQSLKGWNAWLATRSYHRRAQRDISGWVGTGFGILNTVDQEVLVNKLSTVTTNLGKLKVPLSSSMLTLAETQSLVVKLLTMVANHTAEDFVKLADYTGELSKDIALAIQCSQTQQWVQSRGCSGGPWSAWRRTEQLLFGSPGPPRQQERSGATAAQSHCELGRARRENTPRLHPRCFACWDFPAEPSWGGIQHQERISGTL
ncbi:uncharacterized protein LOC131588469 [Poecile atricapillus]|uniref:uncharacterized protein LOC131588469 n=1 Tax=Poecile atricapillus TaxID=48891 RepID=UPI0027391A34|nr:uncharacterized protein LOC131588469 [Poecile atricapillus]